MCGIVGYIGPRKVSDVLLRGMRSLEYRGYDSAGIALMDGSEFHVVKEVGKVDDLSALLDANPMTGTLGIGHTRWATHGGVTQVNAHPHLDLSSRLVLVHNGIVENYREIRKSLSSCRGGTYKSETDTEVVAELLSSLYRGDMVGALSELQSILKGSFALAILSRDDPDRIYCLRQGSPLVTGTNGKGESFCASDVPAILPYTQDVVYLDDGDIAELSREGMRFWNSDGEPVDKKVSQYRLGRLHGGQGGVPPLHAQGDQ